MLGFGSTRHAARECHVCVTCVARLCQHCRLTLVGPLQAGDRPLELNHPRGYDAGPRGPASFVILSTGQLHGTVLDPSRRGYVGRSWKFLQEIKKPTLNKNKSPCGRVQESLNDSVESHVRQQQRRKPAIAFHVDLEGSGVVDKRQDVLDQVLQQLVTTQPDPRRREACQTKKRPWSGTRRPPRSDV